MMTVNSAAESTEAQAAWTVGLASCVLVAAMTAISRLPMSSAMALTSGLLCAGVNIMIVGATFMHLRRAASWVRWSLLLTVVLLGALLLLPILTIRNTTTAATDFGTATTSRRTERR